MSRDCCEVIHKFTLEHFIEVVHDRYFMRLDRIQGTFPKGIPDALVIQAFTAESILTDLMEIIEEDEITVDKDALEKAKREPGAY